MPELVQGENTSESIQAMALCPDGTGYWVVTNTWSYTPAEGEGFMPADGAAAAQEGEDGEAPADAEAPRMKKPPRMRKHPPTARLLRRTKRACPAASRWTCCPTKCPRKR